MKIALVLLVLLNFILVLVDLHLKFLLIVDALVFLQLVHHLVVLIV